MYIVVRSLRDCPGEPTDHLEFDEKAGIWKNPNNKFAQIHHSIVSERVEYEI